jgi:hypothetical protein
MYIETENMDFFRDLDVTDYTVWLSEVMVEVATKTLPNEIDTMVVADKIYYALSAHESLDLSAKEMRNVIMWVLQNDNKLSKNKAAKVGLSIDETDIVNDLVCGVLES